MRFESKVSSLLDVVFGGPHEDMRGRNLLRKVEKAKPVSATTAPIGELARIEGTVEMLIENSHHRAPFSGDQAAYWGVELHTKKVSAGIAMVVQTNFDFWVRAVASSSAASFWVVQDDDTRVLVDFGVMSGKECAPGDDRNIVVVAPMLDFTDDETVNTDDEVLNAFLLRHDIMPLTEMGRTGDYKFLEASILPSERVAVWGRIGELEHTNVAYRDAPLQFHRLTGSIEEPIAIVPLDSKDEDA